MKISLVLAVFLVAVALVADAQPPYTFPDISTNNVFNNGEGNKIGKFWISDMYNVDINGDDNWFYNYNKLKGVTVDGDINTIGDYNYLVDVQVPNDWNFIGWSNDLSNVDVIYDNAIVSDNVISDAYLEAYNNVGYGNSLDKVLDYLWNDVYAYNDITYAKLGKWNDVYASNYIKYAKLYIGNYVGYYNNLYKVLMGKENYVDTGNYLGKVKQNYRNYVDDYNLIYDVGENVFNSIEDYNYVVHDYLLEFNSIDVGNGLKKNVLLFGNDIEYDNGLKGNYLVADNTLYSDNFLSYNFLDYGNYIGQDNVLIYNTIEDLNSIDERNLIKGAYLDGNDLSYRNLVVYAGLYDNSIDADNVIGLAGVYSEDISDNDFIAYGRIEGGEMGSNDYLVSFDIEEGNVIGNFDILAGVYIQPDVEVESCSVVVGSSVSSDVLIGHDSFVCPGSSVNNDVQPYQVHGGCDPLEVLGCEVTCPNERLTRSDVLEVRFECEAPISCLPVCWNRAEETHRCSDGECSRAFLDDYQDPEDEDGNFLTWSLDLSKYNVQGEISLWLYGEYPLCQNNPEKRRPDQPSYTTFVARNARHPHGEVFVRAH